MVVISMAIIRSLLWLLLLAMPLQFQDPVVAHIMGVYHLQQHVNCHKETEQQHTQSGGPECSNKLLVAQDHKHSW